MPTPFFFETKDGKRLFATTDQPTTGPGSATGVVICHAFAEERQKTYRATYHFTRMLRDRGFPSFRFDYFGTGDSDGDMQDITLDRMLADTLEIAPQARESMQCDSLVFLGIRLGAIVAGRAVTALSYADSCAMWNPVINGSDYYRGLKRTQKLIRLSRLKDSPPKILPPVDSSLTVIEADLMCSEMTSQIANVNLLHEPLSISHLLVTGRQDDDKEKENVRMFTDGRRKEISDIDVWLEQPREYWSTRSMYDAYFPNPTFEKTLDWLEARVSRNESN